MREQIAKAALVVTAAAHVELADVRFEVQFSGTDLYWSAVVRQKSSGKTNGRRLHWSEVGSGSTPLAAAKDAAKRIAFYRENNLFAGPQERAKDRR